MLKKKELHTAVVLTYFIIFIFSAIILDFICLMSPVNLQNVSEFDALHLFFYVDY
jgi:hypothetical protein